MLKKLQIVAQHALFPSFCYLCNRKTAFHFPLCRPCLKQLPHIEHACYQCGQILEHPAICGQCLRKPPFFDRTISCFAYQGHIKSLLLQYKFKHSLYLCPLFARLLKQHLRIAYKSTPYPQCIIPMSLHNKRVRQRGFNPSLEIGKYLSKFMQIPLNTQLAKREVYRAPQSTLRYAEREKNVRNVFSAAPCDIQHIALLDDVMTTGATFNSLAKSLKKAGIKDIDVWCVARTLLENRFYAK